MLILSLLLTILSTSERAHAAPTDCPCGNQTISEGRVLKDENAVGASLFYGYRVEVVSLLCPTAGGTDARCADIGGTPQANRCLALVKHLGWYSQDLSGTKIKKEGKSKKTGVPLLDRLVQERSGHTYRQNLCGGDFQFDVAYESTHPRGATPVVAQSGKNAQTTPGAVIGSRPRPDAAAVQIDTNADPRQATTAIAVDPNTGEPIVDPDIPLNAELDKQLKAQGWSSVAITHGFRPGTIVAARKKLKLVVGKGQMTKGNMAAVIFHGKKYKPPQPVKLSSIELDEGQLGEVVSTGIATPGGAPQVYVLWRKKKSNWLPLIRDIVSVVVGIQYSPALAASSISNLLGGWQSYGEIKLVLAPADAVDLEIVR